MPEERCRVCGLEEGEERWSAEGWPLYIICSACGAESGVDDLRVSGVRQYRDQWIKGGASWFAPEERPTPWSLGEQLGSVAPAWL